jgi:hypothetical protein
MPGGDHREKETMAYRPAEDVNVRRIWTRQNVIILVLSIFIILSTLMSAVTLGSVWRVRDVLRAQLAAGADKIGEARQQTINYEFPIQQSFPISTTVQLNETLDVPINTTVPIRESISVPVDVPVLGRIELPVELNMDVPVSMTVNVAINKEIPIATSVDLNTTIPLQIELGQPPLGDVLRELEDTLRELLRGL